MGSAELFLCVVQVVRSAARPLRVRNGLQRAQAPPETGSSSAGTSLIVRWSWTRSDMASREIQTLAMRIEAPRCVVTCIRV